MQNEVGKSKIENQVKNLERLAYILDSSIKVPFTKFSFGLDSLIGLVPGVGDFAGAGLSFYLLYQAFTLGVSKTKLLVMLWNSLLDGLFGVCPFLGDVFDIYWKSNSRNVEILRLAIKNRELTPRTSKSLRIALVFLAVIVFIIFAILIGMFTKIIYQLVR